MQPQWGPRWEPHPSWTEWETTPLPIVRKFPPLGPQRPIDDHPHPFRRDLYQHYLPRFRKHLALLVFVVGMFVWGLIGTRWNLSLSLWGAAFYGLIVFVIYRVYFKDYNPSGWSADAQSSYESARRAAAARHVENLRRHRGY